MSPNSEKTQPMAGNSSDVAALEPGQEIYEYRIKKVLGGGGFGITYLAQDVNLELPVAIKEYFPSSLAVRGKDRTVQVRSSEAATQFDWGLERFIDEARALASFKHANIIRVLRYFKENGTAYIVMEYESGDPLARWLKKQKGLDQRTLLKIVYPLLDGLESIHKLNFLHRDIKPDNIYIRADGSPVLLDFGAARRLIGDSDLTNIVSPGFAPFEQYHSKGNQGPWTDLYSLGAVMYWITTGLKPVEAASRIQEDAMPKAVERGSSTLYGEQMLQAIDWALSPDEKNRPQSVAELRDMLQASEHMRTEVLDSERLTEYAKLSRSAGGSSAPGKLDDLQRKNVMGTIMFLDLVGYSTHSVNRQVAIKTLFNELINKAISGVSASSRIMLDTGDGAAICFLGDPEEALQSALLLRDLLAQKYGQKLSLRVGLHMGPLRLLMDINNRVNVVGDGINVAQRIMDFSSANQIMVSRAFFDVISRISDGAETMFEYLGAHLDKHSRTHAIYALVDPNAVRQKAEAEPEHITFEPTQLASRENAIPQEEIQAIETDLAKAIGPLAHVLLKKTMHRAADGQALRELLSISIQDVVAREAFVHPKSANSGPVNSGGVGGSSRFASSVPRSDAGDLSRSLVTSRPLSAKVDSAAQRNSVSVLTGTSSFSMKVHTFTAEQQNLLVRALSLAIGPLAKTLVRKEAARQPNWTSLMQALSAHIDKPDERTRFMNAAKGIQSGG
jgi:serine/threonine protein kinase